MPLKLNDKVYVLSSDIFKDMPGIITDLNKRSCTVLFESGQIGKYNLANNEIVVYR